MQLTEARLRTLIRTLLEADEPDAATTTVTTAPTEKTAAEKDAAAIAQGVKTDFDDQLADLLAKKMKDKGATESSISYMKLAVADGR